ncbi:hypothetical protein [Streptomyces sp. NPDC020742]|uniref:hypothetical protein n=1 Tax=Streptomyces sp. NPDC020742 TaxID=3154897 RepID=UPI0034098A50
MPRGRHRQSPHLHRLLPPTTVAGASIACAAGAWFVGDDLVQRVLAAGAAAAALSGAVLLRNWDRKAGRKVAELTRARVRDEWRTEERIAELETDVEESRERRAALEAKLRAKRAELARLRSEHAELLRRYATAETERASALEGRRLLAIEAAPPKELPAGADVPPALRAGRAPVPARREPETPDRPAPAGYAEADRALRQLARNAARQRATQQAAPDARELAAEAQDGDRATPPTPPATPPTPPAGPDARGGRDGDDAQGNGRGNAEGNGRSATVERKSGADRARKTSDTGSALRPVPAAAIAPPRPAASRELGGFDFFGNKVTDQPQELPAPLEEDLADVVGDEAVAEQSARAGSRRARRGARKAPAQGRNHLTTSDTPADGASADSVSAGGEWSDATRPDGERPDAKWSDAKRSEAKWSEAKRSAVERIDAGPSDADRAEAPATDGAASDREPDGATTSGVGEVIDLTAHDETEQLDVNTLRSAIS